MESATNLPEVIPAKQGPEVPVSEHGLIRSVLWAHCKARFVGIQKTYGLLPGGDLILFNTPGNRPATTLAVPVTLWQADKTAFIALVQHKIFYANRDADIAKIRAGLPL